MIVASADWVPSVSVVISAASFLVMLALGSLRVPTKVTFASFVKAMSVRLYSSVPGAKPSTFSALVVPN